MGSNDYYRLLITEDSFYAVGIGMLKNWFFFILREKWDFNSFYKCCMSRFMIVGPLRAVQKIDFFLNAIKDNFMWNEPIDTSGYYI